MTKLRRTIEVVLPTLGIVACVAMLILGVIVHNGFWWLGGGASLLICLAIEPRLSDLLEARETRRQRAELDQQFQLETTIIPQFDSLWQNYLASAVLHDRVSKEWHAARAVAANLLTPLAGRHVLFRNVRLYKNDVHAKNGEVVGLLKFSQIWSTISVTTASGDVNFELTSETSLAEVVQLLPTLDVLERDDASQALQAMTKLGGEASRAHFAKIRAKDDFVDFWRQLIGTNLCITKVKLWTGKYSGNLPYKPQGSKDQIVGQLVEVDDCSNSGLRPQLALKLAELVTYKPHFVSVTQDSRVSTVDRVTIQPLAIARQRALRT